MASTFQDPDYHGSDNSSLFPAVLAEVVVSLVLTTSFTVARLAAQKSVSSFDREDYWSIAAWAVCTAYSSLILAQAIAGAGQHIWNVPESSAITISKLSWAIELSYCVTCWVAKVALVLQLRRTFAPHKKGAISTACMIIVWGYFLFCLSSFVAKLLECVPTARIWNPKITTGHCIDNGAVLISEGAVNIFSDIVILILPIWAIFHLKMSLKKKFGISAVFATGLIAVSSSICRLIWTFPILHDKDKTYLIAPLAMWSLAEITSIILCTCFPLMPRFVRMLLNKNKDRRASTQPPPSIRPAATTVDRKSHFRISSILRTETWTDWSCSHGATAKDIEKSTADDSRTDVDGDDDRADHDRDRDRDDDESSSTSDSTSAIDAAAQRDSVTIAGTSQRASLVSNGKGYITVHREFQVRHGVDAAQLEDRDRLKSLDRI